MGTVQGVSSGLHGQTLSFGHKKEPSLQDLENERESLVVKKTKIEAMLADKNMTFDDGTRMSKNAYFQKRQSLIRDRADTENRLSALKPLIRNARENEAQKRSEQAKSNPGNIVSRLREIQSLLFDLINDLEGGA